MSEPKKKLINLSPLEKTLEKAVKEIIRKELEISAKLKVSKKTIDGIF